MEMIISGAKELNIEIDERTAALFMKYADLLVKWNEKMNLTAITEPNEIIVKHFLDCASVFNQIDNKEAKIIDIGTGAGFPGVVLKLLMPDIKITLCDSLNKRITFLNALVEELGLENVETVHARAEDLGQNNNYREKFDYCVSRAVADLRVLSEYCLPFVKPGGRFISMKGAEAENEVLCAKDMINELGAELFDIKKINLPFSDITHSLIIINKLTNTSPKYPRKPKKIQKNSPI